MQEMSRRNQHFTDSVIRRMTRISNECGAINLAQGFPDFDPPKEMMDRLEVVSHEGPHQYPITMGAPNFRQAIARKCGHFMGRTIDPETEIVATIGSTEAMVDTLFALTNPGDRVVMFSPFFENYRAQVIMADCEPVFVPLNPPLTRTCSKMRSAAAPRPSSSAIPRTRAARSSPRKSSRPSPTSASATTFTPSWTRCMSTSSTTAASTSTRTASPACGSARSPARRSPRPTPSPAGDSAMPSRRRTSWRASASTTTSTPSAARRL